ncbi:MAG: hypothetical protein P4L42_16945 [Desulfocapsaceae bacterium]|nr:hypothetical protein [Desulfocapsaceae bacterium]
MSIIVVGITKNACRNVMNLATRTTIDAKNGRENVNMNAWKTAIVNITGGRRFPATRGLFGAGLIRLAGVVRRKRA